MGCSPIVAAAQTLSYTIILTQRNEVIGDSAPETLEISSTRPSKGDGIVATPGQAKGAPTTHDQEEIPSAPVRSVSPSSDTQRPPEKVQDAPVDDVGEFSSKPTSDILDKQRAVVPEAQHGAATDKALDKQIIVPSGQDFVHPKQPSSSPEQKNGGIGDSAPLTQRISSTKARKGDVVTAPDQAKDPQKHDILPPVRSISGSSDIQHPSGKVHDNVRADDFGEAKPIVEASAPETQDDTASDEIGSDEKKIGPSRNEVLSEPTSSIEPRNEEIRDSAPLTHLASSTETMKENATIISGPEEKDLQTTLDQPDILSKPIKLAHSLSQKTREDAPADDLREASSKPSALVREVIPSTVVPASPPETQQGAARDETLDKQKFVPSDFQVERKGVQKDHEDTLCSCCPEVFCRDNFIILSELALSTHLSIGQQNYVQKCIADESSVLVYCVLLSTKFDGLHKF